MSLVIYNTLTRETEPFETLEPGKVRMYVCGPTVYSEAHVGTRCLPSCSISSGATWNTGLRSAPRHELHRRGRQDHRPRRQTGEDPAALANRYTENYKAQLDASMSAGPRSSRVSRRPSPRSSRWWPS